MDSTSQSSFRSPAAWLCLLIPLVIGLTADLYTKHWAMSTLVNNTYVTESGQVEFDSREVKFIPGYLHFRAHSNYGAVFGIGQGAWGLFIVVSIMAITLLGYLFAKSGNQRLYQILLGMLLAGVLGNMYDRIFVGYVRDMIYALDAWKIFPWIFNIADMLLCTGVGGMFVYSMFRREEPKPDAPENAPVQRKSMPNVD